MEATLRCNQSAAKLKCGVGGGGMVKDKEKKYSSTIPSHGVDKGCQTQMLVLN